MVNMPAAQEAVDLAGEMSSLSVGLHFTLTEENGTPSVALADSTVCQLRLAEQMNRFQSLTGQPPTHLDSHHNIHRHPRVLPLVLEIASQYGLPLREHSPVRYFPDFYGQWDGETHLEQISIGNLKAMLASALHDEFTELSCHPGYTDSKWLSAYSLEREAELRTLCDPSLPEYLKGLGIALVNFRDFVTRPVPVEMSDRD
jgi:predicted glycoside hydrolase/deacetylase ChbG (UPF0249 family)